MRTIFLRDRVTDDDVKSVKRRSNVQLTKSTLIIPDKPMHPIVLWGYFPTGGDESEAIKSCLRWPPSSDSRCHNCAYYFDGVPVPLPVSKDELRSVYFCQGNFCSWQCAKSFNMRETAPAGRGNRNMYIGLLAYKTWIKLKGAADSDNCTLEKMKKYCSYRLDPALPRANLVEFGGKLSIEEYRRGFCGIVPPDDEISQTSTELSIKSLVVLSSIDADSCVPANCTRKGVDSRASISRGTKRIETKRDEELNNSFCKRLEHAKVDPALMVRKKDMDVSNTLVFSMGIEIKKRLK